MNNIVPHENSSQPIISKYDEELKFLIKDKKQLHAVYRFVKKQLVDIVATEKKQIDHYFDDSDLTLHEIGVSFRIRESFFSGTPKYSLDLKMKNQNNDAANAGIYKRREAKQILSAEQLEALKNGASLDQVDPVFYELLCGWISTPSIDLKRKFSVLTTRRELTAKTGQHTEMTLSFDEMKYDVFGTTHPFFELEIKFSTGENNFWKIISKIFKRFDLIRWNKSKYDRGIYLYKKENHEKKMIQRDELIRRFNLSGNQVEQLDKYRSILDSVYQDYIFHKPYLLREEKRIISELQTLQKDDEHDESNLVPKKYVHSLRSRLKNVDNVIAKIVRKADKYFQDSVAVVQANEKSLSAENYKSILTDLIGVRVMHLFKDNWLEIDEQLTTLYNDSIVEKKFYVRKGDEIQGQDLLSQARQRNFDYEEKESGYRSAHYLIKREVIVDSGEMFITYAEIQVRTVFEEAWGEVDHEIRYPHYEHDLNINHFLKTFNRIVGSADEMATYIKAYRDSIKINDII